MTFEDDLRARIESAHKSRAEAEAKAEAAAAEAALRPRPEALLKSMLATAYSVLRESGAVPAVACTFRHGMLGRAHITAGPLIYVDEKGIGFTADGEAFKVSGLHTGDHIGTNKRIENELRNAASNAGAGYALMINSSAGVRPRPTGWEYSFYMNRTQLYVGYSEGPGESVEDWLQDLVAAKVPRRPTE